jgi:four helix bundle protein
MTIALKEANESAYWLELLHQSDYIAKDGFDSIWADNQELSACSSRLSKKARAMDN